MEIEDDIIGLIEGMDGKKYCSQSSKILDTDVLKDGRKVRIVLIVQDEREWLG